MEIQYFSDDDQAVRGVREHAGQHEVRPTEDKLMVKLGSRETAAE